jgi:hypothetical protein
MNRKTILATLAGLCVGVAMCLAADVNLGTWKLNEAKSKYAPGSPVNRTVVYVAAGDGLKVVVDGVAGDGKTAIHSEWTGKFDGKDYPVTGDPNYDSRSYTKVDDHTVDLITKQAGKPRATGRIVVAADGKSRTLTTTTTDASGKKTVNVFVYDKQ